MSAKTILTTPRLDLVPLDPERDAAALHELYGDPLHDPFGTACAAVDVAETRTWLQHALVENGGWAWAVRLRPDTAAIGTIGLFSDQGTSIRGMSWYLRRTRWGEGIMSEAAPIVVDHLLAQPHIDGVEAWIDTRNLRSIGVARRAGMREASTMSRVYPDHIAQQVVMVRAASPRDCDVVAVRAVFPVTDVAETARLLADVLGMHLAVQHPDPPTFARLTISPWSGVSGIDIVQSTGPSAPSVATIETGISPDDLYRRAVAAGLTVDGPPQDQPWYRRTFTILLPEGHRIQIHGPLNPERPPVEGR